MVKLYEGGAYLLHGTEVIADAPDALAAVKSKTGIETTKEAAAKETMAYGILVRIILPDRRYVPHPEPCLLLCKTVRPL